MKVIKIIALALVILGLRYLWNVVGEEYKWLLAFYSGAGFSITLKWILDA